MGPDGFKPDIFREEKPVETQGYELLTPGQALRRELDAMPKGAWDGLLLHSVPFIMGLGMIGGLTYAITHDVKLGRRIDPVAPTPTITIPDTTPTPQFTIR